MKTEQSSEPIKPADEVQPHIQHRRHENSLASFWAGQADGKFSKREVEILHALQNLRVATDRELAIALGFSDMNGVRPRISEMLRHNILEEVGSEVDPVTKKTVRRIRIRDNPALPQFVGTQSELLEVLRDIATPALK